MKTEMEAARDAALEVYAGQSDHYQGRSTYFCKGFDAGWNARGSQWVAVRTEADYPDIGEEVVTASDRAGDKIIYEKVTWDEGEAAYAGPSHNSIIAYMPIPPYTADSGQEGE